MADTRAEAASNASRVISLLVFAQHPVTPHTRTATNKQDCHSPKGTQVRLSMQTRGLPRASTRYTYVSVTDCVTVTQSATLTCGSAEGRAAYERHRRQYLARAFAGAFVDPHGHSLPAAHAFPTQYSLVLSKKSRRDSPSAGVSMGLSRPNRSCGKAPNGLLFH